MFLDDYLLASEISEVRTLALTRNCSIAAESHIRSHHRICSKIQLFCKHIEITLNIILYEFIVSRHTIKLQPREYINWETMSPLIIFVMEQIHL